MATLRHRRYHCVCHVMPRMPCNRHCLSGSSWLCLPSWYGWRTSCRLLFSNRLGMGQFVPIVASIVISARKYLGVAKEETAPAYCEKVGKRRSPVGDAITLGFSRQGDIATGSIDYDRYAMRIPAWVETQERFSYSSGLENSKIPREFDDPRLILALPFIFRARQID